MTVLEKLQRVLELKERGDQPMPPGERNIFWNANAFGEARNYAADKAPAMARALLALWPALEAARDSNHAAELSNIRLLAIMAAFENAKKEIEHDHTVLEVLRRG